MKLVQDYEYQNITYPSGFIFDFWSCSSQTKYKDHPDFTGAYPAGFLKRWMNAFWETIPHFQDLYRKSQVLHVCAGGVDKKYGVTQDISDRFNPDLLCNAEEITDVFPSLKERFPWILGDPPYNPKAAMERYNVPLLKKSKMLQQMERCCKPGGYIGILDQTTQNWKPKNLKKVAMIAVTSIPNLDARLFTVYRKESIC